MLCCIVEQGLGTASSFSGVGLEPLPGERHFTEKFDKDRTGTCSKVEFKIGLERQVRSRLWAQSGSRRVR